MLLPVCYCRPVHCYLAVFGLCVDAAFLLPHLGWPDFISSTTWRLRLLRGVIFDHTVCSFIWCHPEVNFKRPRVLSMLPSSCQDHKTRFCLFFLFLSLISKTLYWYFCLTFIILSQVNIYLNCGFVCLVVTLSVFFLFMCDSVWTSKDVLFTSVHLMSVCGYEWLCNVFFWVTLWQLCLLGL